MQLISKVTDSMVARSEAANSSSVTVALTLTVPVWLALLLEEMLTAGAWVSFQNRRMAPAEEVMARGTTSSAMSCAKWILPGSAPPLYSRGYA